MGFRVFGIEIRWYGVIIALAILIAFLIGNYICRKQNFRDDVVYWVLLAVVPLGIILARLYYVVFDGSITEYFHFRNGGMAIYGGVIGGAIGLFIFCRIRKCGYFVVADILVICGILAQSIGRWGNFFNTIGGYPEGHGFAVGHHVPPFTVMVNNVPHLAVFFFESILNLAGFVFLLWIFFKKQKKWGVTTACYFLWYGVVRAILEPLRADPLKIGKSDLVFNRISFLISLLLICLGGFLLFANKKGWLSQKTATLLKPEPTEENDEATVENKPRPRKTKEKEVT